MSDNIGQINFTIPGIQSLDENDTYLKINHKKTIKICAYAITAIALFFIGGVFFKNQAKINALDAIDEAVLMNKEIAHLREILNKYKATINEDDEFVYQAYDNKNGDSENQLLLMLHKLLKNNANKVNTFDVNNESNKNIDPTYIFRQKLESMQDNIKYASKFFKYMKENNKKYENMDEQLQRFENFKIRYMKTQKHNEMVGKNGLTYVQKVNQYSDFSKEEFDNYFKKLLSVPMDLKSKYIVPLKKHLANTNLISVDNKSKDFPDSRDYRSKFNFLPPKDQGNCGSCWAFAAIGNFEYLYVHTRHEMPISFSEQQMVDCSTENYGCDGGNPFYAFLYMINNGVCLGDEYPYKGHEDFFCLNYRCSLLGRVHFIGDVKPNELIMALNYVGPVTIAVGASEDFVLYSGGVFDGECNPELNHSVLLVGYGQVKKSLAFEDSHSNVDSNLIKKYKENIKGDDDDDIIYYWIVRNSWGPNWGEGGYIRIKRNKAGDDGFCGVGSDVFFPIY
ncbi:chabaupain 1 [Plasmodium vinckei vinckei]|uniref:Vinckepain-1 n=5 Tax=Plasmodium vinckei TaxID=5860 RepID=PVP1_PLAVN|nr:chabaupain 1 [Plasmodium vinckei vinckei]P46102.1 RecName: Full=Vinckepain-1; AltName: Full=Cysteine proteinase vinckepain-1; Flags: Precursor [Plasmodium vinckei]KEG04645.1 cysteine proteinase [Plasmodium vinckei vinckei]VEV58295.1 chabaupain 1 [Plasmodium vinckei vinckei]